MISLPPSQNLLAIVFFFSYLQHNNSSCPLMKRASEIDWQGIYSVSYTRYPLVPVFLTIFLPLSTPVWFLQKLATCVSHDLLSLRLLVIFLVYYSWFWGDAHVKGGVEHAVFEGAKSAVVLFDGECNFCNSGVWMMISNSEARNLRFCAQNVRGILNH